MRLMSAALMAGLLLTIPASALSMQGGSAEGTAMTCPRGKGPKGGGTCDGTGPKRQGQGNGQGQRGQQRCGRR